MRHGNEVSPQLVVKLIEVCVEFFCLRVPRPPLGDYLEHHDVPKRPVTNDGYLEPRAEGAPPNIHQKPVVTNHNHNRLRKAKMNIDG